VAAPLRIAVLGAGVHGGRYAEHLLRGDVAGAALAGVSRRDPAAAAAWRARGVRFETDALALAAAPGVDAVVVASPPDEHLPHARAALRRGLPLLLEKPVAHDAAALAEIRTEAARSGVPVLVGHALRYDAVARRWRDEVRAMGRLRFLGLSQRHERMPQAWQMDPARGGGALLTLAVHLADLARWATGREIAAVDACVAPAEPGRAEGTAAALARLEGGALLALDCSLESPGRRGRLEAFGDDGALAVADHAFQEMAVVRGREREAIGVGPRVPGLVPLLGDFAAAARGGSHGEAATLEDGARATEFALECRRLAGLDQAPR
jgi:myo-inositol 2-dehydrogenase/D-chiro-inositol 1-dehydrogenase